MNKTRITYVVMILVFSLGLWGILRAGSRLRAAPDVAGEWAVTWEGREEKSPERLTVTQSGKFINAKLDRSDRRGGVKLRGTLERGASEVDVVLKGVNDPTAMTAVFDQSRQTLVGSAGDGSTGGWRASRVPQESSR
jgi:hypothetical protein